MKFKHTTGPWTVAPLGTIEFKGGFIGEAYDMNPGYYGEKSEDLPVMANARLMAAAPEMLELLQALTGFDSIRKACAKQAALNLLSQFVTSKQAGDHSTQAGDHSTEGNAFPSVGLNHSQP